MTSLDSDGDGLLDGEEQRLGTRVDLADTDGDGLSDTAEVRTHGTTRASEPVCPAASARS